MPRSIESYADGLGRIVQELARAKLAADADLEFLSTIEQMIIERLQNPQMSPQGVSVAGGQPGFSAQQMQGGQSPGGAVPVQQAPTRLPAPQADMSAAINAFREAG